MIPLSPTPSAEAEGKKTFAISPSVSYFGGWNKRIFVLVLISEQAFK
jgi:hypothetical protein